MNRMDMKHFFYQLDIKKTFALSYCELNGRKMYSSTKSASRAVLNALLKKHQHKGIRWGKIGRRLTVNANIYWKMKKYNT